MPIDEYSLRLGELGSDVKTLIKIHALTDDKLSKIIDATSVINHKADRAHERIDSVEAEMITKTGAMKAVIGGGLISGAGFSGIYQFIKSYLGIT